jgi:hypothetical protein
MAVALIFAVLHTPPSRIVASARHVGFYFHELKQDGVSRNLMERLVYSLMLAKTDPNRPL